MSDENGSLASFDVSSTDYSQDLDFGKNSDIGEICKDISNSLEQLNILAVQLDCPSGATNQTIYTSDDDDDQFEDACDNEIINYKPYSTEDITPSLIFKRFGTLSRRNQLPVNKETAGFSVWSFLRHCIGKDLTRVTMPVTFNEPLSFTQRICEDLEYVDQLHKAAICESTVERLAYIAGFAASCYNTLQYRYSKPFNPFLGETYELVRQEMGFYCITEQTSHHPPITSFHVEADGWTLWGEVMPDLKFRGNYCRIIPLGLLHLRMKKDNYHYTWQKPENTIHNLIFGDYWVDHEGTIDIRCHQSSESASVVFTPCSKSSSKFKNVTGQVKNAEGEIKYQIFGTWDEGMSFSAVNSEESATNTSSISLWSLKPAVANAVLQYGFTEMAMSLNGLENTNYCLTDARLRPDQRLLEEGSIEEAADMKHSLEEKQRRARKFRETNKLTYKPRWFAPRIDPDTNSRANVYMGEYWTAKLNNDFQNIPDIY